MPCSLFINEWSFIKCEINKLSPVYLALDLTDNLLYFLYNIIRLRSWNWNP
jgi:hypothetical protein